MPELAAGALLRIELNGVTRMVAPGTTVAAALLTFGVPARLSHAGEPRTALCGMGVCYECRARINGVAHQRSCLVLCAPGMRVETE